MKVLVLYQLHTSNDRNTIKEHLNSFKTYSNNSFHYVNILKGIPKYLLTIEYDLVIFHYTYLAGERFLEEDEPWLRKIKGTNLLKGFKIAIPQDEYDHTQRLCDFFDYAGVNTVYTCFMRDADIDTAYRNNIVSQISFKKTWTGFVDEKADNLLMGKRSPLAERSIDIGYRARKLPAYFGKHGQLKFELVNVFTDYLKSTDLIYDINNTNNNFNDEDKSKVKMGNSWIDFLLNCKAFIGCEGGSSLLDYDGSIKKAVLKFSHEFPNASFDEIEKNCFPGIDFNIQCYALSPRHFECATTKTLQVLVEGSYGNVFKPNKHFIELKRDFSNISEVVDKLHELNYCQKIVDQAYTDIVLSGKYTYKIFVEGLFQGVPLNTNSVPTIKFALIGVYLRVRNWYQINRAMFLLPFYLLRNFVYRAIIIPNPVLHESLKKVKKMIKNH